MDSSHVAKSLLQNSWSPNSTNELFGSRQAMGLITDCQITPSQGIRKMKTWLTSAKVVLGNAAETFETHLQEICNYFENRTTSGVTEGLNTRIKLILRQSYGFKNFDLMRDKLLVCLFK
jgi:hypothetical protein